MTTKKNLQRLKGIVYEILKTDKRTRSSDSLLYLRVLERVAKDTESPDMPFSMTVAYFLTHMQEHGYPPFESVRRARQKAQAEFPELKACDKVEEMRKENEKEFREFSKQKTTTEKPVRCIETGQIFRSSKEAAKAFGVSHDGVGNVCRGDRNSINGMHFEYLGNNEGSSLCWKCANAYGSCSWTGRDEFGKLLFEPVPGWVAKPTQVSVGGGKKVQSYCVLSCPEFIEEHPEKSGAHG